MWAMQSFYGTFGNDVPNFTGATFTRTKCSHCTFYSSSSLCPCYPSLAAPLGPGPRAKSTAVPSSTSLPPPVTGHHHTANGQPPSACSVRPHTFCTKYLKRDLPHVQLYMLMENLFARSSRDNSALNSFMSSLLSPSRSNSLRGQGQGRGQGRG